MTPSRKRTTRRRAGDNSGGDLDLLAKEINARLEKAAQMEGKADDHRLAACIQLAAAEAACKAQGVQFSKWAKTNVKYSYETVRQYVRIGKSGNPRQALDDARQKARAGMAEIRAERKEPRRLADESKERERRTYPAIAGDRLSKVKPEQMSDVVSRIKKHEGAPDVVELAKGFLLALSVRQMQEIFDWMADELGESESIGKPAA